MSHILEYCDSIRNGELVKKGLRDYRLGDAIVGDLVLKAYLDLLEPVAKGTDKEWYLDESASEAFIYFAESFCVQSEGDGAGKLYHLELFQKAFAEALLGIKSRATGLRRFTEAILIIGRKNGKTAFASILGLYLTIIEPGARVYCAATTQKQAREVWDGATAMIDKSAELQHIFHHVVFPAPIIKFRDSRFEALSNDPKKQDGLKVSGAIIDEIHALARRVYDVLVQGTSTRREPMVLEIGSAGFVRGGLYDDKYDYGKKVVKKVIDDPSLLFICYEQENRSEVTLELNLPNDSDEAKAAKKARNEEREHLWLKSNPGLYTIKRIDRLEGLVTKAMNDPNAMNEVLTKDFNIIGVDCKAIFLKPEEIINDRFYTDDQIKELVKSQRRVIGGLDLSLSNDMSSFTTLVFDKAKDEIIAINMNWISQEFLDSEQAIQSKVPWRAWIERGLVRIGGQHYIDPKVIVDYTDEARAKYGWTYQFIHYDQYAAEPFVTSLEHRGYARNVTLLTTYQGTRSLNAPMRIAKAVLQAHKLIYQGNPVMRWALSNVETVTDNEGCIKPNKKNADRSMKIDPAASLFDAMKGYEKNYQMFLPSGLGMGDIKIRSEKEEKE